MCRFAAYVGPPAPLATLLYDPPHALEVQAYRPRELVSGHVNVDGTGAAWWANGDPRPLRYVSERPPWADPNLRSLGARLEGAPILAAVQSITEGMPAGEAGAHPFVHGSLAGAHNGFVEQFKERAAWQLLEGLSPRHRAALASLSDSLLLFLLVVDALDRDAELDLAAAVVRAASRVAAVCDELGAAASLNLVVAGPGEVTAVRTARRVESNSLYTLEGGSRWPDAGLLASEPLDDDPGWTAVPPEHVVTIDRNGIARQPI